jgi:hypothetical protein
MFRTLFHAFFQTPVLVFFFAQEAALRRMKREFRDLAPAGKSEAAPQL